MIESFLQKLGASTKITVGVSISPGIGLEMIEIDRATKTVNKYGFKPLDYNYSTREINDYSQFQESLTALFDELNIPKKSNVILNIPNIHFGIISLPLLLVDDAITNAIISEVEQSYIFKRQEPVVNWMEVNANIDSETRSIAYTAIQQTALDGYKAACQEVGCTLIGVETSHASLLKALYYTEVAKEQMKDNVLWNLMVIGQNNYSIFSMVGKKVIEYYEEPLALKSFVDDEIYNAISSSAQLTLAGLPANHLFIVSETELVSAEVLSMKLPFEGKISFLECNKYAQTELMAVNLNILPTISSKITPEAVGIGIYTFCDFPFKFNLSGEKDITDGSAEGGAVPRINIGGTEVELNPEFTKKMALVIGAVLIIPLIIALIVITNVAGKEQTKLDDLNQKITKMSEEIKKYSSDNSNGAFDLNAVMNKIGEQNRSELFYFSALQMSVPKKLWITYYMTNSSQKVDIKGKATDVESVYSFYKSLKQLVNGSDIRLYKLEIVSESIDNVVENIANSPRFYEFEITNMTAEELNPAKPADPNAQAATPAPEKKQGFELGKPLFGGGNSQQSTPSAAPPPNTNPSSGTEQLPKNLQSIEKF